MKTNMLYNGYRIIVSEYLTEEGPEEQVKRTWKERLFTLPFTPFQKYCYVKTRVPSREALIIGDAIVMHPEMAKKVTAVIDEMNKLGELDNEICDIT